MEKNIVVPLILIMIHFLIGKTIEVGINCKLGEKIYENVDEHYIPLRICDFQYVYLK